MRVTEFEHGLVLAAPSPGYVRSSGLHMSDVYNSLAKEMDPKRYDKRDEQGEPMPFDSVKMELGTSFEEVLEPVIARRLLGERPGEFFTFHPPGIAYSPDQLFYEDDGLVLGEFKLTWYSSRGAPFENKFTKWWWQMKAYAYHLQTNRARLYVFFVNGDYQPPSPQLRAWEIEFTDRELESNWKMLLRHGKKKGLIPA